MDAQGWYLDPFGTHEQRWFSLGAPTDLVRDEGVEATDPPADSSWSGELQRAPEVDDGTDLTRADDWDQRSTAISTADGFAAADVYLG